MIGKHYLVSSSLTHKGKIVYRHFTIANCMREEFYKELLRVLQDSIEGAH
jgi:hypothetical protein